MIIETERLKLLSLTYEELIDYVKGHKGFIKGGDEEKKVWDYTVVPMSEAPIEEHLFYTIWRGYFEGEDIVQVGFLRPVNELGVVEIWCHVKEGYMNRGFGTEAMKGLIEWAKQFDDIEFVGASAEPQNLSSKRMIEKCGLKYECDNLGMNIFFIQMKNTTP